MVLIDLLDGRVVKKTQHLKSAIKCSAVKQGMPVIDFVKAVLVYGETE